MSSGDEERDGGAPRTGGLTRAELVEVGVADSARVYAALAAKCPARGTVGVAPVMNAELVSLIVRDRRILGTGADGPQLGSLRPIIPLELDGEEHTKYRKLLDPLFTPRKVAHLEPSIRQLANELIDSFIAKGSVDAYAEFCAILPPTVFLRMMGIPLADLEFFQSFKNDIVRIDPGESPHERAERFFDAALRCYGYFEKILDERAALAEPGDDLLGWFLSVEMEGLRLTRENILDIVYLLMIAGLDTVAASLSCILSWLARHPEDRRRLVANPALWPGAIEELMRVETPVPIGVRKAIEDVQFGDTFIPAGTTLNILWAAANVDPERFEDPLRVDFERSPNPHYSFAAGFHRCLGSHLARLELRVALEQFHARLPDYEIAPGAELRYEAMPVRLVSPLPLVWSSTPTS